MSNFASLGVAVFPLSTKYLGGEGAIFASPVGARVNSRERDTKKARIDLHGTDIANETLLHNTQFGKLCAVR